MSPSAPAPDLEIQLARKDIELGRLQETNLRLEEQARQTVEASRKELTTLREKLAAETQKAEQLTRELSALPPVAEIDAMKRRLHVLQALDTSAEQSNLTSDDSVERLFREKAHQISRSASLMLCSCALRRARRRG